MLFFLRCIIGPPSSMNLRNVLWHGFISPDEFLPIPAKWYCTLMLTVTMSVCNIIRHKGVIVSLKKRDRTNFNGYYYLIQCIDKTDDMNGYIPTKENFDELYKRVMYGHGLLMTFIVLIKYLFYGKHQTNPFSLIKSDTSTIPSSSDFGKFAL